MTSPTSWLRPTKVVTATGSAGATYAIAVATGAGACVGAADDDAGRADDASVWSSTAALEVTQHR